MGKRIQRIKTSIRKGIDHRVEKAKLKKQEDQILIERAGELVDTDQEIATQILGMVKDPSAKISGLSDLQESLDSDNIKEVVSTLLPEERPLIFREENIIKELKKMDEEESNVIIKEAIYKTNNQTKKLDRLYECAEMLSDYDVIGALQTVTQEKLEDKKVSIIARKIASNYLRFGDSMHLRELCECIQDEKKRASIPERTAEEFDKLRKRAKNKRAIKTDPKVQLAEKIKKGLEEENRRYARGVEIKRENEKKKGYGR